MKALYLLRHAKSSWSDGSLSDKERPLNNRGLHDAPMMGERFAARDEVLDRVVASPALRARSTAELFSEKAGFSVQDVDSEADLYFLGSGSIEDVIRMQDEQVNALLLVFHNPDITHFVNSIDYDLRIDNVPTCGLIRFDCGIAQWRDWSRDKSDFDYFDYPKNLSGEVVRN